MPDHEKQSRYNSRNCGFEGKYEFDLTIVMLGRHVTCRARVLYEHTPSWQYFDLTKNALFAVDIPETVFRFEILAIPRRKFDEDGTITQKVPYWVDIADISEDNLFSDLMVALCEAIDERCKSEDKERRKVHKGRRRKQAATGEPT